MDDADRSDLSEVATRLARSERAVAFTGAGISTESGISDFRSPGGIWSRHQPVTFQEFVASEAARRRYWLMKAEAHREFAGAQPNAGHRALAALETEGILRAVITQNIDGLHQDAGSRRVLELHGTARWVVCLDCGRRIPADGVLERVAAGDEAPRCDDCAGVLKPATVSFGQTLPSDVLEESIQLASEADVFLAIGSSLVVYPAAGLPAEAKRLGAHLVIINREETPLDGVADAVIRAPIGSTLEGIAALASAARR